MTTQSLSHQAATMSVEQELTGLIPTLRADAVALHQMAATADIDTTHAHLCSSPSTPETRAAAFRAIWELHRAAEMLTQITDGLDRAHHFLEEASR